MVEEPVTVKRLPPVKVKAVEVPTADVPAPNKMLPELRLGAPVPPLLTGRMPVTPVDKGKPVALVKTSVVGVPKLGVIKVGEVAKTFCPVPVLVVTKRAPLEADSTVPELKEDKVVEAVTVKVPVLVVVAKKE